jgi:hypothetical protein
MKFRYFWNIFHQPPVILSIFGCGALPGARFLHLRPFPVEEVSMTSRAGHRA